MKYGETEATTKATHEKPGVKDATAVSSYSLRDGQGNLAKAEKLIENGTVYYEMRISAPHRAK